jgi:outer membrane protein OmpA-like peptidoglycan-associated protein
MGRPGAFVEHRRRPWWLLVLIPLAVLGIWMWQRGRAERMVAPVIAPEVRTPEPAPTVRVPTATPSVPAPAVNAPAATPSVPSLSFPSGSVEANFLAHVTTPVGADESTWFELDAVEFDTGVATLRPPADAQVERIAQILQANPSIKIKVGGYTDASGSREDNMRLSEARAESVRQALVAKGIDGARIEVAGYGEHDKAVETEGATQANRRVAIRVSAR